ncbi:MAG: 50S ribosomal protein L35 [Planctomycetota bacterium]|nr:50S ribosomal protein L35 [Planctomycetota bacterium]MDI6788144.1 50S ribosomal protein L35 [Planctomycetota bacterium]
MPKLKSNKAVTKRIKVTATGKLMRYRSGKSHLLSTKSAKRRRHLRKDTQITSKPFIDKISRLIHT